MRVWTVSWEAGSGGGEVAGALAARAGVPLIDGEVLEAVALALGVEVEAARELERDLPGRLATASLMVGLVVGPAAAQKQLELAPIVRRMSESVIRAAARSSCVVLGRAGFAVLADEPAALHVRIRAPLEWRIARYAARELVSSERAREEVVENDHDRIAYVKRLYGRRLDDPANFNLALDASRFSSDELVELLLQAHRYRALGTDG